MRDYSFVFDTEDVELRRELMRELGRTDLFFFCKYILNMRDLEERTDIHHKLCYHFDELSTRGHEGRMCVMMFRNSFKTSLGIGWLIQQLTVNPNYQIGIGSDIEKRAQERLLDMRNIIEHNELLKTLYPEVFFEDPHAESDLWTNSAFNVKRGKAGEVTGGFRKPSVSCFGLDPLPTGSHYDVVLIDDIENESNCADEDQIAKLTRNFKAFLPTLNPGCILALLGTVYCENGPNTFYQSKWFTYKRPCYDKYGEPTFPSRWDRDALEKMKRDMDDDYLWQGQYLLKPARRTDLFFYPFTDVRLNRCRLLNTHANPVIVAGQGKVVELRDCFIYILVDPAGGMSEEQHQAQPKVRADTCGFAVLAVDKSNTWYVLRLWRQFLSDEQLVDRLFALDAEYHPYLFGIEKMPHLDSFLRSQFQLRGKSLHISELKPRKRSKADRIRALKPLLPSMYFDESHALQSETDFHNWHTEQDHEDDHLDALAYAIDVCRPPQPDQLHAWQKHREQSDDRERLNQLPPNERKEWEFIERTYFRDPAELRMETELQDFFA